MADTIVNLPDDTSNAGKKVDNSSLTVGANTVLRQRLVVADDATAVALAKVTNATPGATDYGLVVREASQGQKTMAASSPVVLASDHTGVPVTGTFWQATQPTSLAALPALAAGTNNIGGVALEGGKATYTLMVNMTPVATPTDIVVITGSATKTVKVRRVRLNGVSTTAGNMTVSLVRRTTANTGGTFAAGSFVAFDTNDAAATATAVTYSANPAGLGTGANIEVDRLAFSLAGSEYPKLFEYGTKGKPIILRGTGDRLAINLGGGAVPAGGSLWIGVEITEE